MNRLRLFIRAFFGFSRMETNAFLLLIPLVLVILFSEPVYHTYFEHLEPLNLIRTDSLMTLISQRELDAKSSSDTVPLHAFDPNTATEGELIGLHLDKATASRIVRYREKGGRFYKKSDVLRIFGMDSGWYRRASAWMRITTQQKTPYRSSAAKSLVKAKDDINTADTIQLTAVYGIGPVLAQRIVKFRDRLGGFIAMHQLREVYGLDSAVVKNLEKRFEVKNGFQPRRIAINEATWENLLSHPYITRKLAQAILAYRSQHGPLDSLGQLKAIQLVDEQWIQRMRPYLSRMP